MKADWSPLSHVVAPPSDAGFVRGTPARALGYDPVRYHGDLSGKRVEIVWIDALGIPAEVRVAARSPASTRKRYSERSPWSKRGKETFVKEAIGNEGEATIDGPNSLGSDGWAVKLAASLGHRDYPLCDAFVFACFLRPAARSAAVC